MRGKFVTSALSLPPRRAENQEIFKIGLGESGKVDRNPDTFFGSRKYLEDRLLALAKRFEQLAVDVGIGPAAIGEALDEPDIAEILSVDLKADAGWQENAQRRLDAHQVALAVGRAQYGDGQAQFRALAVLHRLMDAALLGCRTRRRLANDFPEAVLGDDAHLGRDIASLRKNHRRAKACASSGSHRRAAGQMFEFVDEKGHLKENPFGSNHTLIRRGTVNKARRGRWTSQRARRGRNPRVRRTQLLANAVGLRQPGRKVQKCRMIGAVGHVAGRITLWFDTCQCVVARPMPALWLAVRCGPHYSKLAGTGVTSFSIPEAK